jgi:hypothetical protein
MSRVSKFTDEQKQTLQGIVRDFGGPTSTHYVLTVMADILDTFKPDWEDDPMTDNPELRKDIEVCMAALDVADANVVK